MTISHVLNAGHRHSRDDIKKKTSNRVTKEKNNRIHSMKQRKEHRGETTKTMCDVVQMIALQFNTFFYQFHDFHDYQPNIYSLYAHYL
mmetsp:Transcript_56918/g.138612  ORF Transcript_56918/g.138612 Transcript_56918/m.138612 type:complete len:88 (-) Transcript_56918:14-277(-)